MKDCIIKGSWQDSKSDNRLVEIIRLGRSGYFPFTTHLTTLRQHPCHRVNLQMYPTSILSKQTHTLWTPAERNPQPKDTARREQVSLEHF